MSWEKWVLLAALAVTLLMGQTAVDEPVVTTRRVATFNALVCIAGAVLVVFA